MGHISLRFTGFSHSPHAPDDLNDSTSSTSSSSLLPEEDDSLPTIEGLQIRGKAFPGQELQACGYSINGTTSCNFRWMRYLKDGSMKYIHEAKEPVYLVTADDIDSCLALEVQPLDNRESKGKWVKVFANEQRMITCDPEMQEVIQKTLFGGHASYEIFLSAGYLDIWELAILEIKREGYSIKCKGSRGVVVSEKFLPTRNVGGWRIAKHCFMCSESEEMVDHPLLHCPFVTEVQSIPGGIYDGIPLLQGLMKNITVIIPHGHATTFSILGSGGAEYPLRTDSSLLRDTIVLNMRLFIKQAVEKKKRKKRGLFS